MIASPLLYLLFLSLLATSFHLLERKNMFKIFEYVPAVIFIYAFAMLFASLNFFETSKEIDAVYKTAKTNLLPAMLFLMLLQVDFKEFAKLGSSLIISYFFAVLSIAVGFIAVAFLFDFNKDMAAAFGALAGSWMGGSANMVAVGSALGVDDKLFAYALVVDSINYTLWVMLLLFLVPFAKVFDRFVAVESKGVSIGNIGCACNMGAPKYWTLIAFALFVSLFSQLLSSYIHIINTTTTTVIISSLFGILASFTKLKDVNGSSEISTTMLYIIVALIGSKAVIENFGDVGMYVFAGFVILVIHATIMVAVAKIFRLNLFSISVASLANIGGVASAPILAATYSKNLVSVGVLMAVMGYVIGTFGGLVIGNILIGM